jgi:hypothetical protein
LGIVNRFEFLVISSDVAAYKTMSSAIQRLGGSVDYTAALATAKDFILHRKLDGVFLDMSVDGAFKLIESIRKGNSNRYAVIFACIGPTDEPAVLLQAGVNFLLYKPLMADAVMQSLNTATRLINSERKRYLRHPVKMPVSIKLREGERSVVTTNISRGGMAVRCNGVYEPGSAIQFTFELPEGKISGQGEVAWTSVEGLMGIKFFMLADQQKQSLISWLDKRELLGHARAASV